MTRARIFCENRGWDTGTDPLFCTVFDMGNLSCPCLDVIRR